MSSVFSFLRARAEPPGVQPPDEARAAAAAVAHMVSDRRLNDAVAEMRARLAGFLPPPQPPLPEPSLVVASMDERAVGLGNRRGSETRGSFSILELKGIRLDALVRFQLWAGDPVQAETAAANLHTALMTNRDSLQGLGFLRLALEASPPAELVAPVNAWRKLAEYRVLYEYRYQDTDGAESLIARIPIHSDPELRGSPQRETTVVTDEMVRWDNQDAPGLVMRGRFSIGRLSALAFIPGPAPSGAVTLTRTFDGAFGPPTVHPTLTAFLAAVAGSNPTDLHAQVIFLSLNDFLTALGAVDDAMTLGDWNADSTPDNYESRSLVLDPAIQLTGAGDRFEIAHQNAALNQVAVVYLRATRM